MCVTSVEIEAALWKICGDLFILKVTHGYSSKTRLTFLVPEP